MDDHDGQRTTLRDEATERGWTTVDAVTTYEEAVAHIHTTRRYTMIVTDLQLSTRSGVEVVREALKQGYEPNEIRLYSGHTKAALSPRERARIDALARDHVPLLQFHHPEEIFGRQIDGTRVAHDALSAGQSGRVKRNLKVLKARLAADRSLLGDCFVFDERDELIGHGKTAIAAIHDARERAGAPQSSWMLLRLDEEGSRGEVAPPLRGRSPA